jgi:DNA-binding transcriptional regulator YhcF (GntR family)
LRQRSQLTVEMKNYLKIINLDEYSITPKYLQISNAFLKGIEEGKVQKDDVLPSINDLSTALDVSRNTIERAYKELKKFRVLASVTGKGYFITNTHFDQQVKVLLLFNKLSSHKKIIYDAFAKTLGNQAAIDFYIYNNDFHVFRKLLTEKMDQYEKIAIIPHFIDSAENVTQAIDEVSKEKLVLVDKLLEDVSGEFAAVYEDFEQDIFYALEQLLDVLKKYHTIKIIFPENSYYSKSILVGFQNFCNKYGFVHAIVADMGSEVLQKGTTYINLMEDDLVTLVEKIVSGPMKIGEDIGVISYNETPIKKIILNGITTISTDFEMMGSVAAELILGHSKEHRRIPFSVIRRASV